MLTAIALLAATAAVPMPAGGYAAVRPGQHYLYRLGKDGVLDEAIVAIDGQDLTVKLAWRPSAGAPARTATKRVPRDVAWFVKTYRPEVGLMGYGESGYDAAYFRAMMGSHPYSHDPLDTERKPPTRYTVPGGAFAAEVSAGTWLARTTHGCVETTWKKVRSGRYPFTLAEFRGGTAVIELLGLR